MFILFKNHLNESWTHLENKGLLRVISSVHCYFKWRETMESGGREMQGEREERKGEREREGDVVEKGGGLLCALSLREVCGLSMI